MWIKKDEYNNLINERNRLKTEVQEKNIMNEALEKETRRLASLITEKVDDCNMGPWCHDCVHLGEDGVDFSGHIFFSPRNRIQEGKVTYCKKHLHEICPEHEMRDDK